VSALDLLSGDAQVFLDRTWASRTHLHRADPADLVQFLSLKDVDELLTSSGLRAPALRIAKDGKVLPDSAFTRRGASIAGQPLTGLVDTRRVLRLFDEGASLVFQGLHRYWPPLTRLIEELELELGHPCQANAYLTPPGSQGFAVHSDRHDVFVFQTVGSKQWEIHGPDRPDDVRMEPGAVLYLPAGTPHAARAQESVSLHVTIGVNQLTWRGLTRRAVESVLGQGPEEHLPAGYLSNPAALTSGLADRLAALAKQLRALDPAVPVEAEIRRFLTGRPTRLSGGLTDVIRLQEPLDDTAVLRRRHGHPCVLLDHVDADGTKKLEVLLGDRSLLMPAWLRPAVEQICAPHDFRVDEVALDPQSRLVLCTRLVREGLLELVDVQPR
jgi:mannose-6-phosphate isomerase-like protein (cupin superfamily)